MGDRRVGDRRVGERRVGDRRVGERRVGPGAAAGAALGWAGVAQRQAHLLLAAGEGDPGCAAGSEQHVEGHGQEGWVAQQLEALAVVSSPRQQVVEGQPVEGRTHGAQAGVSKPQAQEVVKQALQAASNS